MARAETIESVGETGGGRGHGPLPRHNTCRMELRRPFQTFPGLITTTGTSSSTTTTDITTGPSAMHLHHHHHHHLHPLQAICLSYSLPYPQQDEARTRHQPSLLCSCRERSESDAEVQQEACSRQGPLPDLLPRNEQPSWGSPRHRAPRQAAAAQEVEVRRVADRLRVIGDEFNATVLHRPHAAPHWQDWRDACRGLLNFITQTLSTLYRLT